MMRPRALTVASICILQFLICNVVIAQDTWPCPGNCKRENYIGALSTMGATELVQTYDGGGTAVVHFEQEALRLNAEYSDGTGDRVFGDCTHTSPSPATGAVLEVFI